MRLCAGRGCAKDHVIALRNSHRIGCRGILFGSVQLSRDELLDPSGTISKSTAANSLGVLCAVRSLDLSNSKTVSPLASTCPCGGLGALIMGVDFRCTQGVDWFPGAGLSMGSRSCHDLSLHPQAMISQYVRSGADNISVVVAGELRSISTRGGGNGQRISSELGWLCLAALRTGFSSGAAWRAKRPTRARQGPGRRRT